MRIRMTDGVIGLIFLVFAILGFYHTYSISAHDTLTYGDSIYISPSFFPRFVLTILAILSVILVLKSIFAASSEKIQWAGKDIRRVFVAYLCFLLYPFLLPRIGDLFIRPGMGSVITSGLFLICTMISLGFRKYLWVLLTSLAVVGFVYIFFVLFLQIMLP